MMLQPPALQAALSKLKLIAVHGPWWRIVAFRYLLKTPIEPLYAAGSKVAGARFTPKGGFDSLYLSGDPVTALAEVNGLVMLPAGPLSVPSPPCTMFAVNGIVTRVLDLTDAANLAALQTTEQEMTGSWVMQRDPPTQILAQAAYESGLIAGIQYGSAKHPGKRNIVVFPDRLITSPSDYLEVHDPAGNLAQRLDGVIPSLAAAPPPQNVPHGLPPAPHPSDYLEVLDPAGKLAQRLGGMIPLLAAAPAPQNIALGLPPAPYQHLDQQNAAARIKAIMGAQLHVEPDSISNNGFVLQPGIFAGALLPALNTHFFAPPISVALAGFIPGERVAALATRINATRDPHIL